MPTDYSQYLPYGIDYNPIPGSSLRYNGPAYTPGYNQALVNFLTPNVENAVNAQSNARGMLNSGPAQDAMARAKYQLAANVGLASSQQNFAAQQAEKDREAARQAANKATLNAGISGGLSGLGTLGALAMYNRGSGGAAAGAAGGAGAGGGVGATAFDPNAYQDALSHGADPVDYMHGVESGQSAAAGPAAVPWYSAQIPGASYLPGSQNPGTYGAGNLAGGALAGYLGSRIGGGSGTASDAGAAGGGLAGFGIGNEFGPWGGVLGAGLGAIGGRQLGNVLGRLF